MRKKILQLFVPAAAAVVLVFSGCAHSQCDDPQCRNDPPPPATVRLPAIPAYPCGEVLLSEPRLSERRVLLNGGEESEKPYQPYEHYWVASYWLGSGDAWVWIPAHEEISPGTRVVLPPTETNSVPATSEAVPR